MDIGSLALNLRPCSSVCPDVYLSFGFVPDPVDLNSGQLLPDHLVQLLDPGPVRAGNLAEDFVQAFRLDGSPPLGVGQLPQSVRGHLVSGALVGKGGLSRLPAADKAPRPAALPGPTRPSPRPTDLSGTVRALLRSFPSQPREGTWIRAN
jgi:hypothetical protein